MEQENAGLRNQISELVIDKEKRDQQFENMSANYESKIQQWKVIDFLFRHLSSVSEITLMVFPGYSSKKRGRISISKTAVYI